MVLKAFSTILVAFIVPFASVADLITMSMIASFLLAIASESTKRFMMLTSSLKVRLAEAVAASTCGVDGCL